MNWKISTLSDKKKNEKIKKILYYKDVSLLWKIFITSLKISFISAIKGYQSIIVPIPPVNANVIKETNKNKIINYVNLIGILYYICIYRRDWDNNRLVSFYSRDKRNVIK